MGQGKFGSKLGRTTSHRKAMLRTMVTSFLKYEKIKTTDLKAKELKKVAEKMITLGKRGDLHARRQAAAFVREREMVGKLFGELSARYLSVMPRRRKQRKSLRRRRNKRDAKGGSSARPFFHFDLPISPLVFSRNNDIVPP
jgi:ribosomal protein L17